MLSNRIVLLIVIATILMTVGGGLVLSDWQRSARPLDAPRNFVGKGACIDCHQTQATLFHGSHHDRAMDEANDETVLANFDNQRLEHDGMISRMFRDGAKFMVHTEGPDGQLADFEVKWVFGYHPLQQYMVELDRPADALPHEIGRVQVLRLSWDALRKEWFYLRPPDVEEKLDPTDPLHWTGITQNWNTSCAYCHSTNLQKNFDVDADTYRTTFSDIDVSCEACHGPGSLHVDIAENRRFFWDRNHHFGLVDLKSTSNRVQVESCAPCHSRRALIADPFRPGCNFDDFFALQLLTDPIYHHDGQVRDENYVYGSFTQSKMYHAGIKCTDCHDPHSAKLKFSGNLVCTSCHQHPAGKYDTPSHHFHIPGTPGSNCVDCHMAETTYMMCDARRDHSFRVPRPDLSVRLGTPNACSQCHINDVTLPPDRTGKPLTQYLDWIIAAEQGEAAVEQALIQVNQKMLDAVENWYPRQSSEPKTAYYEQLAIGQSSTPQRIPALLSLARDQSVPGLYRASAMALLQADPLPESAQVAVASLGDRDAKVVVAAVERLEQELYRVADRASYRPSSDSERSQMREILRTIGPMLEHSATRVRRTTARVLVGMPPELLATTLTAAQKELLQLGLNEYRQGLLEEHERGEVQMQLASLAEMLGDLPQAQQHYQTAIRIDPNLTGPRSNLAALLDQQRSTVAQQLQSLLTQSGSADVAAHRDRLTERLQGFNLQVDKLRAEEHQLLQREIQRAAGLPNLHSLYYRYAMSCYLQRDLANTETFLLEAYAQQPQQAMYSLGLATYYLEVQNPQQALVYIRSLRQAEPDNEGYRLLLEKASQMLAVQSLLPELP